MIIQKYNLNLIPDKVPVFVRCSQYDKLSRDIEFDIYYGDTLYLIPNGTVATVRGTKPDKTGFEYPCSFNTSTISFSIQDQMTVLSGQIPCEIRMMSGTEILGTCNFILDVEACPLLDDTVISDTDLPLIEEASQAADRAESAAAEAETVLESAIRSARVQDYNTDGTTFIASGTSFTITIS